MKYISTVLICTLLLILGSGINQVSAQFPYIQHPEPTGLIVNQARMNELNVDPLNLKWVCFADFGLGAYDGNNWTVYNTSNSPIPSDSVICIEFDGAGNSWIGTNQGAAFKVGNNWSIFNTGNSGIQSDVITDVLTDGNDTWLGTYNGLSIYDGNTWLNYNTSNSPLPNDSVTKIVKDSQGDFWIGTRNGLARVNGSNWTIFDTTNSALKNYIFDLEYDQFGRVWVMSGYFGGLGTIQEKQVNYFFNGSLLDFFDDFYFVDIDPINVNYTGNTGFSKDIGGTVYFQVYFSLGSFTRYLVQLNNQNFELFGFPFVPFGINLYGNELCFDQTNKIWWLPHYRFYFYELDFNNYIPSTNLTTINFNNYRTLDINKVKAGINVAGDMHWDLSNPRYEVPQGSGKHSVFASAFWIGGLDGGGQLHIASQTYRQSGNDYWPGPISGISVPFDSSVSHQFNRIWKIDKWKVEEFNDQFAAGNVSNGTYQVPEEILTWPAIGNGIVITDKAPFSDANADGVYNPMDGDYPEIKGDQMLFYIFNDSLALHTNSNGEKMGIEVHASAYAYNCDNIADSLTVLNHTTLYNYKIINQSNNNYGAVYMGLFCDVDLGNYDDDYIGCDSSLATGFVYNSDNNDDGIAGYGLNPPMQNVKILQGTLADVWDNMDNDLDGFIDEPGERTTMNHFQTWTGLNNSPVGNPVDAIHYYNYMQSLWLNGTHVTFGSDGLNPNSYPTDFIFSGLPYGTGWTEPSVGNPGGDRVFLLSSGPFSLFSGDTATIDFAYIFTRDSLNPNGLTTSTARNVADLDRVQSWFDNNNFPSCENYTVGVNATQPVNEFSVYPNPVQTNLYMNYSYRSNHPVQYFIYNLLGELVQSGNLNSGSIEVGKLPSQLYLIKIVDENKSFYSRFIKQ